MLKKYTLGFAVLGILCATLIGCARAPKVAPDYPERALSIRRVGILAPDLYFYDVSMGGIREKRDDWSEQANKNVVEGLSQELKRRGFEVKVIGREGPARETAEELTSLFTAIFSSYRAHANPESQAVFPHKAAALDYSLGPLDDLLDAHHVDALFLVDGYGQMRTLLMAGGSSVWMALTDRNGKVLWLDHRMILAEILKPWDIRNPINAATIVTRILSSMPEAPR